MAKVPRTIMIDSVLDRWLRERSHMTGRTISAVAEDLMLRQISSHYEGVRRRLEDDDSSSLAVLR